MSECKACGKPRPPRSALRPGWGCGYCNSCYRRWVRQGRPADGPVPRKPRGPRADRIGRIEDYAELRSWGVADSEAAQRLGVSPRTLQRYKSSQRETETAS